MIYEWGTPFSEVETDFCVNCMIIFAVTHACLGVGSISNLVISLNPLFSAENLYSTASHTHLPTKSTYTPRLSEICLKNLIQLSTIRLLTNVVSVTLAMTSHHRRQARPLSLKL